MQSDKNGRTDMRVSLPRRFVMATRKGSGTGERTKSSEGRFKITFRFWLAYLAVIFSVLLFVLPVYVQSYNSIKNNIMSEGYRLLREGFRLLDTELGRMQGLGDALRNEMNFSELSRVQDDQLHSPDYYTMYAAQKYMRTILPFSDIFSNQLFMFRNNELLISRERIYVKHDEVEAFAFRIQGVEFKSWVNNLRNHSKSAQFQPGRMFTLFPSGESRQTIAYVLPLPSQHLGIVADSWLVCLIDAERILQLIGNSTLSENGFIRITDASGQVLLNHGISSDDLLAESAEETYEAMVNGEMQMVMTIRESSSGLRVIAGIPLSYFSEPIMSMTTLMFIYLALAIAVGLFVSLLMARRSGKSLSRLLNMAEVRGNRPIGKQSDFERLGYAIHRLGEMKEHYRSEVETLGELICSGLMDKLLAYTTYSSEEEAEIEKHLPLLQQDYCVSVLRLHNTSVLERSHQANLAKIVLADVLSRHIQGQPLIHLTVPGRVVVVAPVLEWGVKDLVDSLSASVADFKATTSIDLTVGISVKRSGHLAVNESYRQALDALRAADATRETVSLYKEAETGVEVFAPCGLSEMQRLYEMLLAGDIRACEVLDAILEETIRQPLTEAICRRTYYTIQNILFFVQRDLSLPKCFHLGYNEDLSVYELFENLKDSADLLCAEVERRKKSRNFRLKESILEYINNSYSDSNLCAAGVSECFGITEKYLFSFVKEQTGLTFGELLTNIRMDRAQELLRDTEIGIGDVAAATGFSSINTFYKVFKRVCGVAPGVWRSSHCESRSL